MENITNKTLLTTMIIIGVVIALMIIPLYPKSYITTRSLGANAFDSFGSTNNRNLGIYLNTNYGVSDFRTSNTRTITETSSVPTTTKTYYYTSYQNTGNLPDESGYGYYYNNGYVPAGCESGTDYSLTTGEPCG